jgi:ligand-binding sensor domain-containing protein
MKFAPFFWLRFVLVFCCAFSAAAQTAYHDELIRFYQGLPSDIVLKTQTDANGFLYVATARGLARYDGYGFVAHLKVKQGIADFVINGTAIYFHSTTYGLAQVGDTYAKPITMVPNTKMHFPTTITFKTFLLTAGKESGETILTM